MNLYLRNILVRLKNRLTIISPHRVLIFILLIPSHGLRAETEVSGEVSGEWNLEGSPYLVIDTLLVPEGDTLRIEPGVFVEFQDQNDTLAYPILVSGVFLAEGEEGDSVYIISEEYPFVGIHQATLDDSPTIILEYSVINSAIYAVETDDGLVQMSHSRIHAERCLSTQLSTDATMEYCELFHLEDDPLERAIVTMRNWEGTSLFQNNTGLTTQLNLAACNDMEIYGNTINFCNIDTYCEVTIHDNVFQRLDCEGLFNSRGTYYVYNNTIVGEPYDHGILSYQADLTVHHNTANGLHLQHFSFAEVDSNVFIGETSVFRPGLISLDDSGALIRRNLIASTTRAIDISGTGNYDIEITQNTLSFGEEGLRLWEIGDENYNISNNILNGDGVNCIGIDYQNGNVPEVLQYNCFHAVSEIAPGLDVDETNLIENPQLIGGNPFDYHLQASSPCIDAGDPESPEDPDGTQADMGCYFYDQSIDNPPVLTSPTYLYGTSMGESSYTARATDDNGILTFHFEGIPDNWEIDPEDLDWVADSAVVEGILPDDEGILSFGVWVEDELGQTDTSEVLVEVRDYTILQGEISGTLSSELSPYYVVHDLIVPAGDSLVIEPGCELLFRYEEYEDYRLRLTCYGTLIAEGTEEDSIRFSMDEDEAVNGGWWGLCICDSVNTNLIEYCVFKYGNKNLQLDSHTELFINNSIFSKSETFAIETNDSSTLSIDNCIFYTEEDNPYLFLRINDSNLSIDSCLFIDMEMETFGSSGIMGVNSNVSIINSYFYRAKGISMDHNSSCLIRNNYFYGVGGSESNNSSLVVDNNIFIAGDRVIEKAVVSTSPYDTLRNNVFINHDHAVSFWDNSNGEFFPVIYNNVFQGCSAAIFNHEGGNREFSVQYNCFWQNDTLTVDCPLDSTNLFLDPAFADTAFHLYDSSPLIDAGNPELIYNDLDGTRNDIGLWGGPFGQSYEYPLWVLEPSSKPPSEFKLFAPYPNPFNPTTHIRFSLVKAQDVRLTVYNTLGQQVANLVDKRMAPGFHEVTFNARDLASGMYFYKIDTPEFSDMKKMVLIK